MFIMRQKVLNLPRLLAAVVLIAGFLTQSCSKKSSSGPDTEPVNPDPVETESLKYIPDSVFRAYLKANVCPNAFDKTGKFIDITSSEVKNFTGTMNIDTVTCPRPFVSSLKGVEYFSKMSKLIVRNAPVDSLNLAATMGLDTLRIVSNKDLQYVNVSGCTSMRFIRVVDIPVTSLNLSNLPALNYVNLISLKRLSQLRTDNDAKLEHIMTYGLISLKTVNVSSNPALRRLFLESCTAITAIDVTHNPKLKGLVSSYSYSLKTVDLSKNDSLRFVMFDDSGIDSIDFSHNPKLVSVAMLRTPVRNLSFLSNPDLRLIYLDGCAELKTVDLRAQKTFDYYSIDFQKFYGMTTDDAYQVFQDGFVSPVPTAQHTIFAQAVRKENGAERSIFGGLRLPQYLDVSAISLTNVKINEACKDNYSLVMARRVLGAMTPALITVYGADQTTVVCNDYSPEKFQCQ